MAIREGFLEEEMDTQGPETGVLGLGARGRSRDVGTWQRSQPGSLSPAAGVRTHSSPYHPLHDDDLGPQRLTDGENVHQPEAEHDEVQGEDDASRVQQPRDEPAQGRTEALSSPRRSLPTCPLTGPSPRWLWRPLEPKVPRMG